MKLIPNLIVIGGCLLLPSGLLGQTTNTFTLPAITPPPGLDTGLFISAGTLVKITASGIATYGYDFGTYPTVNPDGYNSYLGGPKNDPNAVDPSAPIGALLISIGPGNWIFAGESLSFTSSSDGELYLLFNDADYYADNGGAYSVTVTVVPAFNAKDTYKAFVAAIAISTNQDGNLTWHKFGNQDLISECAAEKGITNRSALHLVYDLKTDNFDVVSGTGTNETLICTPLRLSGGIFLNNTNRTLSERLAWVYWGNSQVPCGTLTATERYRYDTSGQLTGFNLFGQLQIALPGTGTNAPAIYQGTIVAGSNLSGPLEPFELPHRFGPFAVPPAPGHFGHATFGRDRD